MDEQRLEVEGVTVDGPTSRDLDDAISVKKTPDGWDIQVHIADVSARIRKGVEIDRQAYGKAFTRYYATGNVPMLPRNLADDQLSLLPQRPRMTTTFFIRLDANLGLEQIQIRKTRLTSKERLSHANVDEILRNTGHDQHQYWLDCLELAQRLLNKRRESGALVVFDLKKGLMTDEEGKVTKMPTGRYYRAYLIVQELMILVNEKATLYLHGQGVPLLFRNHTTRQEDVREHYLQALGELLIEPTEAHLKQLGSECRHIMNRARYAPDLEGHFALNLGAYAHWTSPIRRYADLVCHRMLDAWLRGEPMPYAHDELKAIGDYLNAQSDEARDGKSEMFKGWQIDKLSKMDSQKLLRLPHGDFRYFVKKLTDGTLPMNDDRCKAVLGRISNGSVGTADIARVLFVGIQQEGDSWNRIKEAALRWLQSNMIEAHAVIELAHVEYGTTSLDKLVFTREEIHKKKEGMKHHVSVRMAYKDVTLQSKTCVARSRKEAEQAAIFELLVKIADLPKPPTKEEDTTVDDTSKMTNPKGFVWERCQAHGIPFPTLDFPPPSGPSHAPEFFCVATLEFKGIRYQSDRAAAASKKAAERMAAQSLLDKLPKAFASPAKNTDVAATDAGSNPIGALQEWCAQKRYSCPEYSFDRSGPDNAPVFACTCVVIVDEGKKEWKGVGTQKGAAKTDAAKNACAELLKK